MNRAQLKENAKALLGNKIFGNTWLMMLLVFLISSIISGVAGSAVAIGALLLMGPMTYGTNYVCLKLARTRGEVDLGDMFKGFKDDLGGNLVLGLLMGLFIFLWSLLLVNPGVVKSYAYSMAFYIKNDHPEYDWRKCLAESQRITQGHKMELFVLDLSFIGWGIVGALCLGIGTLWVTPYQGMTKTLYYEEMKHN